MPRKPSLMCDNNDLMFMLSVLYCRLLPLLTFYPSGFVHAPYFCFVASWQQSFSPISFRITSPTGTGHPYCISNSRIIFFQDVVKFVSYVHCKYNISLDKLAQYNQYSVSTGDTNVPWRFNSRTSITKVLKKHTFPIFYGLTSNGLFL